MALFEAPKRSTGRKQDLKIVKNGSYSAPSMNLKGGNSLLSQINNIKSMVARTLGKYENEYIIIREEQELHDYLTACLENKMISIDTETNSLDPITCKLAGICIYTPTMKPAYIPVNHVSYVTGLKSNNQLDESFLSKEFGRIADSEIEIIMFNAKFDVRVLRHQLNIYLTCTWDGMIAARLLNENEPSNALKLLYKKYILNGEGDSFGFESLFKGIPFTHIPITTGYLYAAHDAIITYELYLFQKPYLTAGTKECAEQELERVSWLFHNVEMPVINVVADMEDNGVDFDFDLAEQLSVKYTKKLKEAEDNFYRVCDNFGEELDDYRARKGSANKLEYPINISSPTQIAIMLYDVLNIKPVDKKKPRGTGEDILQKIDHPVSKAILEYRGISKLLSTYIDKLPNSVSPKDGRIHCSFKQIGADTGRFSSSDPNLQNIPSKNHEIRQMFKASEGKVLLSSDYSAQEPRITAHMSQDEKMIKAYADGKDVYCEIASLAFNVPYDECMEFRPDGTHNKDGKLRRTQAKSIVLGICYGRGVPSISEQLMCPVKKGQYIYDSVLKAFPGLDQFTKDCENMAREKGYVDTIWGRKRRLPKMQLDKYEFINLNNDAEFDPLNFDNDLEVEVPTELKKKYTKLLDKSYGYKQKIGIKERALIDGVKIIDNSGYIAEATRQCVNSRIQGSAADMTKMAMILVGNDKRLKELGFKLLIPVHDELIGECPRKNAKEVSERFSLLMVEAAKDLCVPSKCDVEITDRWYGEEIKV